MSEQYCRVEVGRRTTVTADGGGGGRRARCCGRVYPWPVRQPSSVAARLSVHILVRYPRPLQSPDIKPEPIHQSHALPQSGLTPVLALADDDQAHRTYTIRLTFHSYFFKWSILIIFVRARHKCKWKTLRWSQEGWRSRLQSYGSSSRNRTACRL